MLAIGKLLELTLAGREPCEKVQLTPRGVKLHWLAEGALLVSPPSGQDQGVDLLLSAGIHGNELIPIHVLDRLIRALARGDVQPRARLLLLFANPPAMRRMGSANSDRRRGAEAPRRIGRRMRGGGGVRAGERGGV